MSEEQKRKIEILIKGIASQSVAPEYVVADVLCRILELVDDAGELVDLYNAQSFKKRRQ